MRAEQRQEQALPPAFCGARASRAASAVLPARSAATARRRKSAGDRPQEANTSRHAMAIAAAAPRSLLFVDAVTVGSAMTRRTRRIGAELRFDQRDTPAITVG